MRNIVETVLLFRAIQGTPEEVRQKLASLEVSLAYTAPERQSDHWETLTVMVNEAISQHAAPGYTLESLSGWKREFALLLMNKKEPHEQTLGYRMTMMLQDCAKELRRLNSEIFTLENPTVPPPLRGDAMVGHGQSLTSILFQMKLIKKDIFDAREKIRILKHPKPDHELEKEILAQYTLITEILKDNR